MASSFPFVSNFDLSTALENIAPSVKLFKKNLDAISQDIKAVEDFLNLNGICIQCEVGVGRNVSLEILETCPTPEELDSYMDHLSWSSSDNGKFRLMYELNNGEKRPLIECPVELRIDGYREIPGLLAKLNTNLPNLDLIAMLAED